MHEVIYGSLCRSLYVLALAVILSAVPVVGSVAFGQTSSPGQSSPPGNSPGNSPLPAQVPPAAGAANGPGIVPNRGQAVTHGVALGDCGDTGQAMVRTNPYALPPLTPPALPANPALKSCEGGRIQMRVEAPRHFGHRLMDPVRVTVLLAVEQSVVVDMQSLARGTITFNGQEFDLVPAHVLGPGQSPVSVEMMRLRDGRNLIKIELMVQSTVPPSAAPYLVFRLDLRYAMGNVRDAQGNATASPDWRVLSTPAFAFTLSATAVSGDRFRENDGAPVEQVVPWPTYSLLFLGLILVLIGPGVFALKLLERMRPERKVSREEVAWRSLDRAFADARRYGFSPGHSRAIASAIRRYLGAQSATFSELRSHLGSHPHIEEIVRVVGNCEEVLYTGKSLQRDEIDAMMRDVAMFLPRP